ncbi:MAG: glutamine-hydrolyzing carbamoyl-phosphate synthase small subunit [Kiritimatiellae bacterium]|nr:glutamine-hydrolyzing carbamoyl-phosphate synthase small subunit [Kiritimatiellia bacterium]MBQ3341287.1 glutamine-hydrolyzing carbamoyl-phosphate synthase small subunit [Kiritimatiellia bacterium]
MNGLIEKWQAERERKAFLALADGTVFHGVAFGAHKDAVGEVVFNTGMCGYQEILTDPSYAGQFVTLTYPEIGNYGVNPEDVESRGLWLSGLVVGEVNEPSNYRSEKSLDEYLKEAGKPGIYGVDTRALTEHIRDHGNQKAYLCVGGEPESVAVARANEWPGLDGQDYASLVTRANVEVFKYENGAESNSTLQQSHIPHVVCYDFGVKTNILRSLASWARVTVVPAKTPAEEVLAMNADGVFLSNGPADPAAVTYAIDNIRKLLGIAKTSSDQPFKPIPTMGICLGHQLLALACGAKTGRLKFGHHGCNHPVKNLRTGKVEITSQNHNFAVLPDSVPDCLEVTHVNLNDNSIEGVRHKTLPAFSVQYHPESCPGPHDSQYLFAEFRAMMG